MRSLIISNALTCAYMNKCSNKSESATKTGCGFDRLGLRSRDLLPKACPTRSDGDQTQNHLMANVMGYFRLVA